MKHVEVSDVARDHTLSCLAALSPSTQELTSNLGLSWCREARGYSAETSYAMVSPNARSCRLLPNGARCLRRIGPRENFVNCRRRQLAPSPPATITMGFGFSVVLRMFSWEVSI